MLAIAANDCIPPILSNAARSTSEQTGLKAVIRCGAHQGLLYRGKAGIRLNRSKIGFRAILDLAVAVTRSAARKLFLESARTEAFRMFGLQVSDCTGKASPQALTD